MAKTNFKPFEFLTIVNTVLLVTILVLSIYKVTQESFSNPPNVVEHEELKAEKTLSNNYSPETKKNKAPKPNINNIYVFFFSINIQNLMSGAHTSKTRRKHVENTSKTRPAHVSGPDH